MARPSVRSDLALFEGYHSPQLNVAVRLNTNEAPTQPPAAFVDAIAEHLGTIDWNRYPDRGAEQLRSKIAGIESTQHASGFTSDNVLAANGSNEVLQSICLAYGGAGRNILTFEPTYAMHSHIARITGATPLAVQRNDDFSIDVNAAIETIRAERPAVTFLCSPNNPTGMLESAETVAAVLDAVESVDGLLVVDEAYGQFAPWSALELIDESRSLVVTRTFSKTWSAAALRLGYVIGPTWAINDIAAVVLPYHLDALTQASGLIALDFYDEMVGRVETLVAERERILAAFDQLPLTYWSSKANFVLFRPTTVNGNDVWQQLVDQSVLVRNCASWPGLEGCLRVTVGTAEENSTFLDALQKILGTDVGSDAP